MAHFTDIRPFIRTICASNKHSMICLRLIRRNMIGTNHHLVWMLTHCSAKFYAYWNVVFFLSLKEGRNAYRMDDTNYMFSLLLLELIHNSPELYGYCRAICLLNQYHNRYILLWQYVKYLNDGESKQAEICSEQNSSTATATATPTPATKIDWEKSFVFSLARQSSRQKYLTQKMSPKFVYT